MKDLKFAIRSLSAQESRIVLTLSEQGRREITRSEIIELLGVSPKAADHVINSLRQKGWLERASWGKYLFIEPNQGPEALGESNILALASRIGEPYYIGYGSAATHYGLTTQRRNVIWLVTPKHLRKRRIGGVLVQIVNLVERKFFGFNSVDVLGYKAILSDIEKTVIDCVERPELAGGIGEAAYILGTACRRLDWVKLTNYLERMGSISLIRRLGWLTDFVNAEIPRAERDRWLQLARDEGRTYLGQKRESQGAIGYNETWHLFINVTMKELHGCAGLARRRTIKKER